jgi:hypothetical protein
MPAPSLSAVKSNNIVALKAPSGSPEHYMTTKLKDFNCQLLENLIPQATNYLLFNLMKRVDSDDPMESLKAIETLGKTSCVGLFSERVQVSYANKSDAELKQELSILADRLGISKFVSAV